jgi:hypothetical protein
VALTVEDGTGVSGAESYAAVAFIDAYWAARPQSPFAAAWAAAETVNKEGAAREATAYIEATWGSFFRGTRKSYDQGLSFPRNGDLDTDDADDDGSTTDYLPLTDANGVELPPLPPQLPQAVAELAARSLSSPLSADVDMGARVKSETKKVGPIEKSVTYVDAGPTPPKTSYGFVADLLAPLLNGAQPNAPAPSWAWA